MSGATKGKVEGFIRYLRQDFWVPLESRLRPLGLQVDAATANVEVHRWLRDVANRRVHTTTIRVPAAVLVEERGALMPLAGPWPGLVLRQVTARSITRTTPRNRPARHAFSS